MHIHLEWMDLDYVNLDDKDPCFDDYLEINDKMGDAYIRMWGQRKGCDFTSAGNQVSIFYKTDQSRDNMGFSLSYVASTETDEETDEENMTNEQIMTKRAAAETERASTETKHAGNMCLEGSGAHHGKIASCMISLR